jgi:hypothetical protein
MGSVGLIPPSREHWLKMVPKVEQCADEMEGLLKKYGSEVFAVNVTIFYENLPGVLVKIVEQLRFQNTKFQEDNAKFEKFFRPTGVPAADGHFQVTDRIEPNEQGNSGEVQD